MEGYITLRAGAEAVGEHLDRKSRFIAQLVHVESEAEAAAHLQAVRARHYDARHNVPAWILAGGAERASDDGEPSRTSGMPTLEVLRSAGLRDVSCVTTRYFGGTLLGPGGLVRAYTAAAQAALADARERGLLVEMCPVVPLMAVVPYARLEQVQRLVRQCGGKQQDAQYAADVTLSLVFKAGGEAPFIDALTELLGGEPDLFAEPVRFAEF